jgi:hypothetical protein
VWIKIQEAGVMPDHQLTHRSLSEMTGPDHQWHYARLRFLPSTSCAGDFC